MRNRDHYCVTNDALAAFAKLTRETNHFLGFDFEQWLYMEYKEPARRRPYTMEEAESLLGKTINSEWGGHIEIVMDIRLNAKDEVLINGMHQEEIMKNSATVDGQPFGVEVR